MKTSTNKIIATGIIMLVLLSIFQLPLMATSDDGVIVLKKADKEFIIYDKENCDNEFEFAFSLTNDKKEEENLNYTSSAKDQTNVDALNVAYITEETYNQFFATNKSAYVWIRNSEDKVTVKAVDLKEALDDEIVSLVNSTTKRIDIDTTQTHETNQMVNGVDTTVTTGKIVIKGSQNAKYYYQLYRVSEGEYKEFFDLADKINNGATGTYNQLETAKQFYDLYTELQPTVDDENWNLVENMEILQPEDTKEGDRYVIWLKEEAEEETIDAKFLISTYQYEDKWEPEQIVLKELVKLPVTYDSIALFVILGIIVAAIIVVAILKTKSSKKENK
ncbi:MAG: hypothetical protein ACI4VQ_04500 [Clostridia bacterium]